MTPTHSKIQDYSFLDIKARNFQMAYLFVDVEQSSLKKS